MVDVIYEIPLIGFIFLALYTIYQLAVVREYLEQSKLKDSYTWLIASSVFFALWGVIHIYQDIFPLSESLEIFSHYIISHGFLLISMVCIAISAIKTKDIYRGLSEEESKVAVIEKNE